MWRLPPSLLQLSRHHLAILQYIFILALTKRVRLHRSKVLISQEGPHFSCQTQISSPQVIHLVTKLRGSYHTPTNVWYFVRAAHKLHKMLYCYWLIIKNKFELPAGRVHRAKSGRVPNAGASVPVEFGYTSKLSEFYCLDVFIKLLLHSVIID